MINLKAVIAIFTLSIASHSFAQVAVQADPDHKQLLASKDKHLAANKKLVYDFWREVFEGGTWN